MDFTVSGDECYVNDTSVTSSNVSCGSESEPCKYLDSCLGEKKWFKKVIISGRHALNEEIVTHGSVSIIGRDNATITSLTPNNPSLVFLGSPSVEMQIQMQNVRMEGISVLILGVQNVSLESCVFQSARLKISHANISNIDNCTFQQNVLKDEREGGVMRVSSVITSIIENSLFKGKIETNIFGSKDTLVHVPKDT